MSAHAWCGACRVFNGTKDLFGSLVCTTCNCEVEHGGYPPRCVHSVEVVGVPKRQPALASLIAAATEFLLGDGDPRQRESIVGDVCVMMESASIAAAATRAGNDLDSRPVAAACLMAVFKKRVPACAFALQTRAVARLLGTTDVATRAVQEHMPGVDHVLAADIAALAERIAPPGSLSRTQIGDLGRVCRGLADDINTGRGGRPEAKLSTRVSAAAHAVLREVAK